MDDDDDKVRRNLVVASALILVWSFLGIPHTVLLEKIGGGNAVIDPSRLWAVGLALLIYLLARFRFQPAFGHLREGLASATYNLMVTATHRGFDRLVARFNATWVPNAAFTRREIDLLEESIAEMRANHPMLLNERPHINWGLATEPGDKEQSYVLVLNWPNKARFEGITTQFELNGIDRMRARSRAFLHVVLYSPVGLSTCVPIVLAGLAGLTLLWRIAAAYWLV